MSGRHRAGKTDHRRSRRRPIALPAMLVLGVAVAGAVVVRGPLSGGSGDDDRPTSNLASVLSAPRSSPAVDPTIAELPAVAPKPGTKKPVVKHAAAPKPSPSRTAAERASRSAARAETGRRCPVVDKARSHPNGQVPESHLCDLPQEGQRLHGDAAEAFWKLDAAYRSEFGKRMCVGSSYRSFAQQADLHAAKPVLAAKPGTSNHGWGLAVDLCEGPDKFGTPEYRWLAANAGRFDFENPSWARQGGSKPEPWHWEYTGE
jgi:LAS superfamily LD-carboxypeptidase LdcB